MTRLLSVQFLDGPFAGTWADVQLSHGTVVHQGHRYRAIQDEDGTYALIYCGDLVAA